MVTFEMRAFALVIAAVGSAACIDVKPLEEHEPAPGEVTCSGADITQPTALRFLSIKDVATSCIVGATSEVAMTSAEAKACAEADLTPAQAAALDVLIDAPEMFCIRADLQAGGCMVFRLLNSSSQPALLCAQSMCIGCELTDVTSDSMSDGAFDFGKCLQQCDPPAS